MNLDDAREAVYEVFDAAWSAQTAPVPQVVYDNEATQAPTDGSAYAEVTMRETKSEQISLGAPGQRLFARWGLVVVRVHAPAGVGGMATPDAYAEVARGALEGKETTNGVSLFATVVKPIAQDGRYLITSIETQFRYVTTK